MANNLPNLNDETRAALKDLLEARAAAVAWRCNLDECDGDPHPGRDYDHARTKQRPPWGQRFPDGEPITRWYFRGGRGAGKTWAGARALAELILWYGGTTESGTFSTWGVVGPTHNYAKRTLIEGDSGLLGALGGESGPFIESYNRADGIVYMKSGAVVYSAGADNHGKGVEGKNLRGVWCDEVGLWAHNRWEYTHEEALSQAVRLDPAFWIYTGTPKQGHPLVKKLIEDTSVFTVVSPTSENKKLPERVRRDLYNRLSGTRRGRQELEGEVLTDTPGALWTLTQLDASRYGMPGLPPIPAPDELRKIVVGWDPAVTSGDNSDEHGIVVAGIVPGDPSHFVILDDLSGVYTPMEAVNVVADAYSKWDADTVVAETNNGGDLIPTLLRTGAPTIPVKTVTATRGKRLRAEPVAALSEQGRLHIVGSLPKLEDQMTTWSPSSPGSPDRLDAMVWAITALAEETQTSGTTWGRRRSAGGK